jgi:hypothetical protein
LLSDDRKCPAILPRTIVKRSGRRASPLRTDRHCDIGHQAERANRLCAKRAAVRRRIVRRGHAPVEKSCLALVLRAPVRTAQAEAASIGLPTGWMLQSRMFGSDVHAAHWLLRSPLILSYEGLRCIGSASQLEPDGTCQMRHNEPRREPA